jgi:hypothetical protein
MTQLIESVLGGGGEMGELMRAVDWSTTALGPLEQWPQSLRICVRIVLLPASECDRWAETTNAAPKEWKVSIRTTRRSPKRREQQ